jgi:predicted O-methyltransferase YrrM
MSWKNTVKNWVWSGFFSECIVAFVSVVLRKSRPLGLLHFHQFKNQDFVGPVQQDEALALFGLIRTLQPAVVVEFGFAAGQSAYNFLKAMDHKGCFHSYGIDDHSPGLAAALTRRFPNFTYHHKFQQDFLPSDVGHKAVDFVFFDASHDLDINRATWNKILPCLTPRAMIAIHDTGTWPKSLMGPVQYWEVGLGHGCWLDPDTFAHQPGERAFVNWILETQSGFQAIHLHTSRQIRNGLTLLQRGGPLS